VGAVGVVDDVIADRAFLGERERSAVELASVHDVTPLAPHTLADAVAAAALARAHGVPPVAVRDGLRAFRPDAHRITEVATVAGVRYVDDSKATNPHAAQASLTAYRDVVWVAGGLAKGASFDDLVLAGVERLTARWPNDLAAVEFGVEDVPPAVSPDGTSAVALAAVVVGPGVGPTRVVVFRRPIEARAGSPAELADLVYDVLVEQVADVLGRPPEDVDPD